MRRDRQRDGEWLSALSEGGAGAPRARCADGDVDESWQAICVACRRSARRFSVLRTGNARAVVL
ncbi:hypothetical protein CIW54_21415 [Paraburkholderia sp. T12-10]|nr:hypothetical protein CIW54_21415 [Paraburkholderia sp. T12-10]